MFLTQQLRGLADPEGPTFKRYFYLLEVSAVWYLTWILISHLHSSGMENLILSSVVSFGN